MAEEKVVRLQQPQQRIRAEAGIGRPGLKHAGGTLYEEWLPSLRGQRGVKTYTEMVANEPVIGGFMFAIISILSAVDWHAEAEDAKKPDDVKAAEFVNSCLRDMADTWSDFVAEALSMVIYGWSFHEVIWKKREGRKLDPEKSSKFDDGLWGWRSFAVRSQDSLDHWEFDDYDRLLGMWQRPPPSYQQFYIPLRKALLFRLNPKKQNPEGNSLLRSCYRPYFFKKRLQELEAIGVERNLAGLPVLYVDQQMFTNPEWADAKATWENVVKNLKRDEQEGVVIPNVRDEHGQRVYELTLLSTGSRRQSDTNALIVRYNAEIAMAALSDFMLLGHSRVGTFALGVTKTELFTTAFSYVLDSIANEINEREVPRLLALNAMPGEARLVHGKPGNVDIEKYSGMVERLAKAGMPVASKDGVRERFIFDQLGLPSGDIGEDGLLGVAPPLPGGPGVTADASGATPEAEDDQEEAEAAD